MTSERNPEGGFMNKCKKKKKKKKKNKKENKKKKKKKKKKEERKKKMEKAFPLKRNTQPLKIQKK